MSNNGLILIADGDDASLLPITDLLRNEGFECNYVPDVTTVIKILKCIKFDLLVVDSGVFGSSTLEIIRELPGDAEELPIILVSDIPLSDSQIQFLKLPVTSCLTKPFCFEELLRCVKCSISGNVNRIAAPQAG